MCLYCKNEELNGHSKETKELFKGKKTGRTQNAWKDMKSQEMRKYVHQRTFNNHPRKVHRSFFNENHGMSYGYT